MNSRHIRSLVLAAALGGSTACGVSTAPTPLPAPTSPPSATPTCTATPQVQIEKVSFTSEDGVTLSGTLFGTGEMAVILAHQGAQDADQTSWQPFARLLAEEGFTALTFDFRGRGESDGLLEQKELVRDVRAALGFLRDRGYSRIVCMGASMGGTSCLKLAIETDLEGLVVIASTMNLGPPTDVFPQDLPQLTVPKLFVCAEDDRYTGIAHTVQEMYDLSPEPKQISLFPGAAHGTELFDTPHGEEFTRLLLDFLNGLR
jgi:pimeloyl-ACP methyl ester carboxylesterase